LSDKTCRAYGCVNERVYGRVSMCKTCLPQEQRRSHADCDSCKDGYFLSGTTCQPTPAKGTVFEGFYRCSQGATGLQIHFDEWPAARFKFYPLALSSPTHNCTGEFNMSVSKEGSRYNFEPGSWTSNPCGYSTVILNGTMNNGGEGLSGEIKASGCSSFQTSVHGIPLHECEDLGGHRSCTELRRDEF
jgi:hypothetical protein